MGNTFTATGFIYTAVFLSLMVVVTIAACIAFFVVEWRKIRYIRPNYGPSKPPYLGAFNIGNTTAPVLQSTQYPKTIAMDTSFIGLVVTVCVIFMIGLTTLIVVGYFKWKEYKHGRIRHNDSRRRSRATTVNHRRRTRRIRVRNTAAATVNNSVQIVMQPPPYSLIDGEAPPPYTPYAVLEPTARRDSIATRPSPCHTPRPLPNLNEQTTQPQQFYGSHTTERQQFTGRHRMSLHTGSTNTPMTTPAGSMFTTSIGGTRDTSASSNMRSVNMIHIINDVQI